jgi:hypothetical protein
MNFFFIVSIFIVLYLYSIYIYIYLNYWSLFCICDIFISFLLFWNIASNYISTLLYIFFLVLLLFSRSVFTEYLIVNYLVNYKVYYNKVN